MAKGSFKYFDVYLDTQLIATKLNAQQVALKIGSNKHVLYDAANLRRKVNNYTIVISQAEPEKKENKFFCQFCAAQQNTTPIIHIHPVLGNFKFCSKLCLNKFKLNRSIK